MKYINIYKINDVCVSRAKYEIYKDNSYYTGNLSKKLKNFYVARFLKLGYTIGNGIVSKPPREE